MAEDRDALEAMAKHSRMDVPLPVTHYLYFPTPELAAAARVCISARDYESDPPHEMMGDWGMLVRMRIVRTEANILKLRQEFTEIAEEHDGEYDGWEAELLPK